MTGHKKQVAAIEGWFAADTDQPHLWGSRCQGCGSYFFPKELSHCKNPYCSRQDLAEVALSRRGRIWSFTRNYFQPPAPYVPPNPFVPYTIAAVELQTERIVILGPLEQTASARDVKVGQEAELVLGTLYEDDENEYLVWKWRPLAG